MLLAIQPSQHNVESDVEIAATWLSTQTEVITTNMEPTHLARMDANEAADTNAGMSTYVDLALLARSRCAIYSRSGLSMAAWMMGGGTDCYEHLERGLESCSASLRSL
jgi:hypothetical protein